MGDTINEKRREKPQGFEQGKLRAKGILFCLRKCGKKFKDRQEEETHYAFGNTECPKAPQVDETKEFHPLNISRLKHQEDIEKAKRKAEFILKKLTASKKIT